MTLPLMPKATAVWLIEKTALTFTQIADFCGMHPLEVQAIADGEVAQGIVGYDPVANIQVTNEEIKRCEADPAGRLKLIPPSNPINKRGKGARYTPVAKRNDRPDAIAFVLRNFPQLSEAQVIKLLGTTKDTIQKVRERSHWNSANIKPRDPVILGLCSQSDLNAMVQVANDRLTREGLAVPVPPPQKPKRPPELSTDPHLETPAVDRFVVDHPATTLPPAVVVHGLDQAKAALAPGLPVLLLSAEGAAAYAGAAWWRAMIAAAVEVGQPPHAPTLDALDCSDLAGRALEALHMGCKIIILHPCPAYPAILERAAPALVLPARPAALNLDHPGASRRLDPWLRGDTNATIR